MEDDEKKAAYPPVIREFLAKKDPSLNLAMTLILAAEVYSAARTEAEVVGIEKVTTDTPQPRPATAIEKPKPVSVSRVANSPLLFPNLVKIWDLTSSGESTAVTTGGNTRCGISWRDTTTLKYASL